MTNTKIIIMDMDRCLTKKEQLLLIQMADAPVNFRTQKIYKNRVSFYRAVWKLRDKELVANSDIKIDGRQAKEWHLRLDGKLLAKILVK